MVGSGGVLEVRSVDIGTVRLAAADLSCRFEPMGCASVPGASASDVTRGGPVPGVVGRSADGRVEIDATLPARLDRARIQLGEPVARLLGVDT
jgi:vacuolar-type H+-ATPase subunit E/Vma4